MEHTKVKTIEVYEDDKSGLCANSLQISARSHVALTPDKMINQTEVGYKYYSKEHLPNFDYPHKQVVACPELTPKRLRKMQDGNYFNQFQKNIKRIFNQTGDKIRIFSPKWRQEHRVLLQEDNMLIVGAGAFANADIVGLPVHKINAKAEAIAKSMSRIRELAERHGYQLTIAPAFSIKTTPRQLTDNIKAVHNEGFKIINIDNGGYLASWINNYPRYLALSGLKLEGFYTFGTGTPRRWRVNKITSQAHLLTLMGQDSLAIEVQKPFAPDDDGDSNPLQRKVSELYRLNAEELGYDTIREHIRKHGNELVCKSNCPMCNGEDGLIKAYRKSNKAGINPVVNNIHDAYESLWGMNDLREGVITGDLTERIKKRNALQRAVTTLFGQKRLGL